MRLSAAHVAAGVALALAGSALGWGAPALGVPLAPGTAFVFQSTDSSLALVPRINRLVVELVAPDDAAPGDSAVWVRVDARAAGVRLFGYEVLVNDARFLEDAGLEPVIRRFILYPSRGAPVEYVQAKDGRPILPAVAPTDWLPRASGLNLERVSFLGRSFVRSNAAPPAAPWLRQHASTVTLDSDVLVASSRHFRDDGTGRHGRDYQWVEFSDADYRTMLDAGFNLFFEPHDFNQAAALPAFVIASAGWRNNPELVLRGNYLGAVMFSDEPAVHVFQSWRSRSLRSPAEMAQAIADSTRLTDEGDGPYGRGFFAAQVRQAGMSFGNVRSVPYPIWDAIASSAWYELESGAGGWCFESRLSPVDFAANVKRVLGVRFPADPRSCIELHIAVARGAARRFHRPWGFAVFGQMDSTAADALFPLTYDAGATYFWFWTSDDGHHVPWARQIQLARRFRAWVKAHPRGDPAEVSRQAKAAVVLPWGYALDDWTISAQAQLWQIPSLALQKKNDSGVPYRDVLASAMREVVSLLQRGVAFDVLFLQDDENAYGYEEVHRVSADAKVKVTPPSR